MTDKLQRNGKILAVQTSSLVLAGSKCMTRVVLVNFCPSAVWSLIWSFVWSLLSNAVILGEMSKSGQRIRDLVVVLRVGCPHLFYRVSPGWTSGCGHKFSRVERTVLACASSSVSIERSHQPVVSNLSAEQPLRAGDLEWGSQRLDPDSTPEPSRLPSKRGGRLVDT